MSLATPILRRWLRSALLLVVGAIALPLIVLTLPLRSRDRNRLVWGPEPIINYKYWSRAMAAAGWDSTTLMEGFFPINERADFDLYYADVTPRWLRPRPLRKACSFYFAFAYIVRHARVMHLPFSGGPLGRTPFWFIECHLLHLAGVRTVVLPFGMDSYQYSKVQDLSLRHALLTSYPEPARNEHRIGARIRYWTRRADAVVVGFGVDGIGRWDVTVANPIVIDVDEWSSKESYSRANGSNGAVRVAHTPNHRGFKGTEFLIEAVERLRQRGLNVELVLIEKRSNAAVREALIECDILIEQLIFSGYALSGIEGMATGLPVVANLEDENRMQLYRRYSFLDECPVVSASPESLEQTLELLIGRPNLRADLGRAGREYVAKYHSYPMAHHLFGAIYRCVLDGEKIDLMNLFHPLQSDFVRSKPLVGHPVRRADSLPSSELPSPGRPDGDQDRSSPVS